MNVKTINGLEVEGSIIEEYTNTVSFLSVDGSTHVVHKKDLPRKERKGRLKSVYQFDQAKSQAIGKSGRRAYRGHKSYG